MQEQSMKKNDDNVGIECVVKSNNGYGRLSLGKLGDKFNINDVVYVLTESEYQSLMQNADDELIPEPEPKREIDKELENLLEVSLKHINETHKEQLEDKDNQINQLTDKLNAMQSAFHQFNIGINQLSALDILFRKKHHQVINDFNESIWIISKEDNIINADNVPAIQEADKQEQ